MIIYFSGTGNSQYAAEQIAKKTGDSLVSLNLLIKQGKKEPPASEAHAFIFVCPTYAWRIPRVVDDYIRKTEFKGTKKVYFILTCGGETANAIHHVRKLCRYKSWELRGFAEIKMPDNYIVMFPSAGKDAVKKLILQADKTIDRIAEDISCGKRFTAYTSKGFLGKLESGYVNTLFYPLFVKAKGFHATENCVSCGKCEELCPLNNITTDSGKPVWSNCCTHCMACINGCPTEAIEYKDKTQGKARYWFSTGG